MAMSVTKWCVFVIMYNQNKAWLERIENVNEQVADFEYLNRA